VIFQIDNIVITVDYRCLHADPKAVMFAIDSRSPVEERVATVVPLKLNKRLVPLGVIFQPAAFAILVAAVTVAAATKAVVASCVLEVFTAAVGAVGVPVNTGFSRSAFVPTATAMLLNSVSISVPLTIFKGLPCGSESFEANDVLFIYWVILVFHS
jgi:hypothetical protein